MPRLSIDISPSQHQRLKAVAALSGQSLKDFVLSRTLKGIPDISTISEDEAMESLTRLLNTRLEEAENGQVHTFSQGELLETLKARRISRNAKA